MVWEQSWGRDLERAFNVVIRLEAVTIWVNEHMAFDFGEEGFNAYTQA